MSKEKINTAKLIPGLDKAIELISGINQNDFTVNEVEEFKSIALMMLTKYRNLADRYKDV